MAELRLYRDIICLSQSSITGEQTTTLITPTSISTYTSGATGTIETLTPVEDVAGRYYVVIDPSKYDLSAVYQLIWNVQYTEDSPVKTLVTRFKFNTQISLGEGVELIVDNNIIEIEII